MNLEILKPWLPALLILLLFLSLRLICFKYLINFIKKLADKTTSEFDNQLIEAFERPFAALILVFGIYSALNLAPLDISNYKVLLSRLVRTFSIFCFFWGIYNLTNETSGLINRILTSMGWKCDTVLVHLIASSSRFIIITLAFTMLATEWNYDINGFITGLGLGGLAFALAAKDSLENIFGGILIIVDKPFSIGDWVQTASGEGIVEEISFRNTKIRTFTQGMIYIPNSKLSKEAITNWSKMTKRRVRFNIGLTYDTPIDKLQLCIRDIETMINTHSEIDPSDIVVKFDNYGASSLDILISYFCIHKDYSNYIRVKEDVNLKIMQIVSKHQLSFAFPSASLYFETALPLENLDSPNHKL